MRQFFSQSMKGYLVILKIESFLQVDRWYSANSYKLGLCTTLLLRYFSIHQEWRSTVDKSNSKWYFVELWKFESLTTTAPTVRGLLCNHGILNITIHVRNYSRRVWCSSKTRLTIIWICIKILSNNRFLCNAVFQFYARKQWFCTWIYYINHYLLNMKINYTNQI